MESENPIRFYYDQYASTALLPFLLRFVSLTNISNRSGIAVQWNGVFIEENLSACMWAATRENLSSGYRKSKVKSQYFSTKGVISGLTDKKGQIKSISVLTKLTINQKATQFCNTSRVV